MNSATILALATSLCLAACFGGSGAATTPTGGTPQGPPPIAPPPLQPLASGIVGAVAGSGVVHLQFALPGSGFESALFVGSSGTTVYGGAPVQAPLSTPRATVNGLTDGTNAYFGLAIRTTGASAWQAVGTVVRIRPGAPVYVDAAANPATANGLSPATAFPSLLDALLVGGASNGGNIWVRAGTYTGGPFPLGPNVNVAGGFDGSFDPTTRDGTANTTAIVGSVTQEVVQVLTGPNDGSLDGVVVDGDHTVLNGVHVVDGDLVLRNCTVRNCADRGVKARATTPTPNRHLTLIGSTITGNASDGLGTSGPIDIRIDLCDLSANGQEGADIDNLDCPDNGTVLLRVTGSRFYGNSFEGLDADLAAAVGAVGTGTFDVFVENCQFERNGLDGLLLDQEHELFPGFAATIVVRGCVARGNRAAGVHIDADARASYQLERLRCTANAGDGVLITSETNAGEVVLATSWLGGNLGAGARVANGNKVLLASHCVFTGNQNGGLRGEVQTCGVCNSVFVRQADARTNALGAGNLDSDGSLAVFVNAPTAFAPVSAASNGTLTVASNAGFPVATDVVADDDGRRLQVTASSPTTLVLDQAPTAFTAPGMLAAYAGAVVVDDARLAIGSPATAVGLGVAGVTAPDAGPFGAPAGGAPGRREPYAAASLHLLGVSPPVASGVAATTPIVLTFDRDLAAASVTADRIAVRNAAGAVVAGITVAGNTITLTPNGAGWSGSLSLRVLGGLTATDGSPLAAALLFPIRLL